jgi:hypothetical protein
VDALGVAGGGRARGAPQCTTAREELGRSKAAQSGFCGHPPDLSVSH